MKQLTVNAEVKNIEVVTDFVVSELNRLDCPMKAEMQICVAIDELFGNIAKYAYAPETGEATVCVETEEDPSAIIITFTDRGKPFDPLKQAEPDFNIPLEKKKEGGLGIYLVRKTMDMVEYRYKDGQNILRIKKFLGR